MFEARVSAIIGLVIALGCSMVAAHEAASLKGSEASVAKQYTRAVEHDFTFLKDARQIKKFVKLGLLVKLTGNKNYRLHRVKHPYVRPGVKLFIERLSNQYRAACGERLVVTSAVRPTNGQPWNASKKSVHPTGMAVDFRTPAGTCQTWLIDTLLTLEARGVLEATREKRPPHLHVAVSTDKYCDYVKQKTSKKKC
jgi:hypothetical protein